MIEDVVGLRAELELQPLPDPKVLEHSHVLILQTGTKKAVSMDIAIADSPRRVVDRRLVGGFINA